MIITRLEISLYCASFTLDLTVAFLLSFSHSGRVPLSSGIWLRFDEFGSEGLEFCQKLDAEYLNFNFINPVDSQHDTCKAIRLTCGVRQSHIPKLHALESPLQIFTQKILLVALNSGAAFQQYDDSKQYDSSTSLNFYCQRCKYRAAGNCARYKISQIFATNTCDFHARE